MATRPTIVILLSTYNGELYLKEQLDSLFAQSYGEFILLVRDDGSSDSTVQILADYAIRFPEKMHLTRDDTGNLGASGSFSWLMNHALEKRAELNLDSLYLMFCDQDDTWYPDKIARQVNAMVAAEAEMSVPTPVLVHSDLQVVASDNTPIADSLADYQGLETQRNRFANMVISNLVTGCTALINEPLARRALPVPPQAIMHDWWLALVASAFGKVVYLDTPLVHYRQHGNNTIGAKERESQGIASSNFWRKVFGPAANEHLLEVARQAATFKARFFPDLQRRQRRALSLCAGMGARIGFVQRIFYRLARRF